MVKAIPDGYHSVTPYMVVNDAAAVIDSISVHLKPKKLTDILVLMEKALLMQS